MAQYTIKPGDTLDKIAQQYGTDYKTLAKANNIANPDLIYAGSTITIPDSQTATALTPGQFAGLPPISQAKPSVPTTTTSQNLPPQLSGKPRPPATTEPQPSPYMQNNPIGSGIDDASFLSLLNGMNNGFQQNNQLVDQKNAVMSAILGNPVKNLSQLPPDIQNVINRGNRDELLLQAQVLNDAINGKNATMASSIHYLTTGYQQAEAQYKNDLANVLNYSKALNAKPSDIIRALYPQMISQMDPQQIKNLDSLSAPLLTSTQIPNFGSPTGIGGYDLSSYATDPNYTNAISSIVNNMGNITDANSAQQYISSVSPSSPITGDMIMNAAQQYGVDPKVLMAQLQQESNFGTSNVAMNNNNATGYSYVGQPGAMQGTPKPEGGYYASYPNISDSVDATAQWLANHRAQNPVSDIVQSYVDGIASGTITSIAQVPAAYKNLVVQAMSDQGTQSPLGDRRYTMAANAIIANYIKLPGYELTANGLPYLQRIAAAEENPGSVSDQDLVDSLTKLNSSGNAITDAQVSIITGGKTFADAIDIYKNKMFSTGGILSDSQRQQVQKIANSIYANYAQSYQPIYDQATKQLSEANIPKQFWTIPDLNALAKASGLSIPGVTDTETADATFLRNKYNY